MIAINVLGAGRGVHQILTDYYKRMILILKKTSKRFALLEG
jgi:hypothetical protein